MLLEDFLDLVDMVSLTIPLLPDMDTWVDERRAEASWAAWERLG